MGNTLLTRRRRHLVRVPAFVWKRKVRAEAQRATSQVSFMGPTHHSVRNFAVTELARTRRSLTPAAIAAGLDLDTDDVTEVLDELEAQLTFLYRQDGRNVDWAYPVTTEATPHRVRLDSGDRFFAA